MTDPRQLMATALPTILGSKEVTETRNTDGHSCGVTDVTGSAPAAGFSFLMLLAARGLRRH